MLVFKLAKLCWLNSICLSWEESPYVTVTTVTNHMYGYMYEQAFSAGIKLFVDFHKAFDTI